MPLLSIPGRELAAYRTIIGPDPKYSHWPPGNAEQHTPGKEFLCREEKKIDSVTGDATRSRLSIHLPAQQGVADRHAHPKKVPSVTDARLNVSAALGPGNLGIRAEQ